MIKKFFRIILIFISLIIAIIGFLMPILPGWPFLIGAFILISPTHGKKFVEKLKDKTGKHLKKKE